MAIYDKDVSLIPNGHDGFSQQAQETRHELFTEVRSTVESQFRQMDEAHDRIRTEELTARLAEQSN
jgi:hypothetical protein